MSLRTTLHDHKKILLIGVGLVVLALISIILISMLIIDSYKKYIVAPENAEPIEVGIVLGAGITSEGTPYKELEARLNSAADAIEKGTVRKLIVSGDNRFEDYNEPLAMQEYLVQQRGIDPTKIQPDFAGRSTYESCERTRKIFSVSKAYIFSAGSHLPRAVYLCRHFGVESYGIANSVEANNATRREFLARIKALYNVHIKGEPTVLGDPIPLQ